MRARTSWPARSCRRQRPRREGDQAHPIRRIALDRETVVDLADHLRRSHELAAQFGVEFGESGYVFSYQPGRSAPWRPDVATARFERLSARAGLPTVRLHDLRQYVATRLIGAGVSVRTVSGRLGHANPATTLSVYSHFLQAADQQAARCWATFSTVRWSIRAVASDKAICDERRLALKA